MASMLHRKTVSRVKGLFHSSRAKITNKEQNEGPSAAVCVGFETHCGTSSSWSLDINNCLRKMLHLDVGDASPRKPGDACRPFSKIFLVQTAQMPWRDGWRVRFVPMGFVVLSKPWKYCLPSQKRVNASLLSNTAIDPLSAHSSD